MKIAVIIPTMGRPEILDRLLAHLEDQERLPDEVIVSAPELDAASSYVPVPYPLSRLSGATGLAVQRNLALESTIDRFDVITFFDDDFLPARSYLKMVETCFDTLKDVAVVMGHVPVDGARGAGLTFDEGLLCLRAAEAGAATAIVPVDQPGAYGCNMSIRTSLIGTLRFDERLVLYGWQEDIDFTGRLRSRGRVVKVPSLFGVHLGVKSARVSGVRLGYSQVINPTYLIRKGTIPTGFALKLIARNVAANATKSLWSEPYIDRFGRLRGNFIGAFHLMRGRIEPEHVLKL